MNRSDAALYQRQGFGNTMGLGARPALVLVDFCVGFADPGKFGGGNIRAAVENSVSLLAFCREQRYPIAFTRFTYAADGSDHNLFTAKVPTLKALTADNPVADIVPELKPLPGELVVHKRDASAFMNTDFAAWLARHSADTLLVAGCVTSGCVRATAVDSLGFGFRPIIVTDCVGDRSISAHEANLFDLEQKYADLTTRDELLNQLGQIQR